MIKDHKISRYTHNGFYTLAVVEMDAGSQNVVCRRVTDNTPSNIDSAWGEIKKFLQKNNINGIPLREWLYDFDEYPYYFNGVDSPHKELWTDELMKTVFGAESASMKKYGFKDVGLLFY